MLNSFYHGWILLLPVILGGCLHMVIVTKNYFACLAIPVHQRYFGRNKTWRGFIVVPIITALFSLLWLVLGTGIQDSIIPQTISSCLLTGFLAGFGYVLFELPNSWLKRKLGAPPGQHPEQNKRLFILFDQLDSAIGVTIVYFIYLNLTYIDALFFFFCFLISAFVTKNTLFLLSLKKTRF
ncbi:MULTISPECIES: CDP-archaeol synthase [unclassified Photorhabdus]|uniref:CDP-archaeol synthase n=1 Tax=unclassified Photorhabdus TaxID=2620880 RepID=UPI000DCE5D4F|nr:MULTISPECIES: CDP-archaeol synthase [unclassified Photorhabdus]RAW99832.1 CDP-diglyceride synthetase [Photorhabdus sp. S10-54]RAW99944.1 CDP-diglyceride synthetase [Photorhabdus sp. S9-53]RAX04154.1 CDP-diglyceride synthetase [Photorhabdus sp. S8-52]